MSNPDVQLLSHPSDPAPSPADPADPMLQNATECDTFSPESALNLGQTQDPPALTSATDPAPSTPRVASTPKSAPTSTCDTTLSPQQQSALWLILSGKTDAAVAASLNVHRSTILRWRRHTPAFTAELHRRRQAIYEAASDRLRTLVIKSLMTLDKALDDRYQETRLETANRILRLVNTKKLVDPASLLQHPADPEQEILSLPNIQSPCPPSPPSSTPRCSCPTGTGDSASSSSST